MSGRPAAVQATLACAACGMATKHVAEFHPHAACLMFKATKDADAVRANLKYVMEYGRRALEHGLTAQAALEDITMVPWHGPPRRRQKRSQGE